MRMLVIPPPRIRAVGGRSLLMTLLLFTWIFVSVSSVEPITTVNETNEQNDNALETTRQNQLRVLSINAANGAVDWGLVKQATAAATSNSSLSQPWFIEEITLDGFGTIMNEQSFQSALDYFEPELRSIFTTTTATTSGEDDALQKPPPDVLIVSSKGVNILTFLATEGLWRGPTVVLSPIPNSCDHIDGTSWETEWKSTMNVLKSQHQGAGPLVIGIGTSSDEQYIIAEMMEETDVCGRLLPLEAKANTSHGGGGGGGFFATCPTWYLQSFPGNHSWKNDADNAPNLAMLIHRAVLGIATSRHDGDPVLRAVDYKDL